MRNEHKEKWSLVWRFAVLGIIEFLIFLVSMLLFNSYSAIAIILGLVLLIASLFAVSAYQMKIMYNHVVLTHVDKEKLSMGQLIKKALSLFVCGAVSVIVMYIVMIISFIIGAFAYNGLVTFILVVINIAMILAIVVLEYAFIYSIIESVLNDEY